MIQVQGLAKAFGRHIVLRDVNIDLPRGKRLAIVGPNGAGKTTLFRILATLSKPTKGTVRVAGLDLATDAEDARRQIGYLSHQPLLYDYLTGQENLEFFGRMYDVPNLNRRITDVLDHVGMNTRRNDLVRTYSRGMRQRLAIARSLLHNPAILLLDEPYTGLDQQAEEMLDALLVGGSDTPRTIMLTTHNLEQGLRLSDSIAILNGGRIAHQMGHDDWDPERFRQQYHEQVQRVNG
jgi:heme exporter protein A